MIIVVIIIIIFITIVIVVIIDIIISIMSRVATAEAGRDARVVCYRAVRYGMLCNVMLQYIVAL